MGFPSTLPRVKELRDHEGNIAKFREYLGENAKKYMASVVSVCADSKQLITCEPNSIWQCALSAAALNLSVNPSLGYAYLVAYRGIATFQIGYKGLIQLAIRSGQYKTIDSTPVFADEVESYNPIRGEFAFKGGFDIGSDRFTGGNPIGYYSYFELKNGFEKSIFMSTSQIIAYAEKYSQAYQYDLREGKKSSPWSKNFDSMAIKTPLKILLSKYGILSAEMQEAIDSEKEVQANSSVISEHEVQPQVIEAMEVPHETFEEQPEF